MRLARASAPCSARKLMTASGMYYVSANIIPAVAPCKRPGALGEGVLTRMDADGREERRNKEWARDLSSKSRAHRWRHSRSGPRAIRPVRAGHPPPGGVLADEWGVQGGRQV